jgi:hypothetical protein
VVSNGARGDGLWKTLIGVGSSGETASVRFGQIVLFMFISIFILFLFFFRRWITRRDMLSQYDMMIILGYDGAKRR